MKAESTKKKYYATARGQSLDITNLRVYVWTTTEDIKVCEWRGSPASIFENYFYVGDLAAIA
jgi:hypothetical protein